MVAMNRRLAPSLIFCALSLLGSAFCARLGSDAQLLWRAEVLHVSPARKGPLVPTSDPNRAGLTFVDATRLIVYEVDSNLEVDHPANSTRVDNPVQLVAYLLDADTGGRLSSRDWGTGSHSSSISVVAGGILMRTGSMLRLLTKDLAEIKKIDFRDQARANRFQFDILELSVSPTGKTIMLNAIDQRANESRMELLDGADLDYSGSWVDRPPLYHLYSISDSEIAAADESRSQIVRAKFGSVQWQDLGEKSRGGCLGLPTFITADLLLVHVCGNLVVEDDEGRVRSVLGMSQNEPSSYKIAFSYFPGPVAFSHDDIKITKHAFSEPTVQTISRRVLVYDLRLHKIVQSLDVSPLPTTVYDFALSPDGSKLAILSDRTVSVYRIPSQTQ